MCVKIETEAEFWKFIAMFTTDKSYDNAKNRRSTVFRLPVGETM